MAFCIASRLPCYSQFLPDLQAKTPAEYDAYLDVLEGPCSGTAPFSNAITRKSSLRFPFVN